VQHFLKFPPNDFTPALLVIGKCEYTLRGEGGTRKALPFWAQSEEIVQRVYFNAYELEPQR
jgi:hypothetical protein